MTNSLKGDIMKEIIYVVFECGEYIAICKTQEAAEIVILARKKETDYPDKDYVIEPEELIS